MSRIQHETHISSLHVARLRAQASLHRTAHIIISPRMNHQLDKDTLPDLPNIDGSDYISVVKSPQPSTKSFWGYLLRISSMLIVVLTLVASLYYGDINRQRHRCTLEIQGYEQKLTMLQQEIQALIAAKEKLALEKATLDRWSEKLNEKRKQIRWINVTDVGCSAYATRRHTALLSNVAPGLNPEKECLDKALSINERPMAPTKCEFFAHPPNAREIFSGRIVGIWDIASDECKLRVVNHEDEGVRTISHPFSLF
jgi:hypothetical protein